jgi:hypothetical protein
MKWLQPNGICMVTFVEGGEGHVSQDWHYP